MEKIPVDTEFPVFIEVKINIEHPERKLE